MSVIKETEKKSQSLTWGEGGQNYYFVIDVFSQLPHNWFFTLSLKLLLKKLNLKKHKKPKLDVFFQIFSVIVPIEIGGHSPIKFLEKSKVVRKIFF